MEIRNLGTEKQQERKAMWIKYPGFMQTYLVRNTEWKETVKTLARIISRGAYILKIFVWDITDIKGNNLQRRLMPWYFKNLL